ncbi:hypothetical protein NC651_010171 [Populus alba x Populus x berolinensis]|nr:hypothetical protein NC651_010171 [Populus alba x Populus x berolinensis]
MAVDLHVVMVPCGNSIAELKTTKISSQKVQKLDIPSEKIQYLKVSYLLQQPFRQIVSNRSADWIIADVIVHWVVEIAQAHDVSLMGSMEINASGISDAERTAKILNDSSRFTPSERPETGATVNDESWRKIFIWLGEQKPNSVVFAGFGSKTKLNKNQIHEIAYGLELSGHCRLSGLSGNLVELINNDVDALPSGFIERTSNKGIVRMRWEPQMETLWHPSIRGSLFHSGWGSVIETSQFRHCLVVLPFSIDQPLNARLLVEKDLAVEVDRNRDGSFSRDATANAMVSKQGEKYRTNTSEAAAVSGNHELHQDYYQLLEKLC